MWVLFGPRRSSLEGAQLALSLELRPMLAVQLHELRRHVERFRVGLELRDRVAETHRNERR